MQDKIRNFAIIAHIDHGKSTLADRFLETTNTVSKNNLTEQFLDKSPVSRKRGITIKLSPVRMDYLYNNEKYHLNLIDTPGHVDFSYEVSRTLAACEGAVLLVDATQGVQAQTVAHFNSAKKEGLTIIPVINKIDMENARVEETEKELEEIFSFKKEEIVHISAKTGKNVDILLSEIVKRVPSPKGNVGVNLTTLIFDALYDEHRGVVTYVRVVDGALKKADPITFYQSKTNAFANDVGYFKPELSPQDQLSAGEIGYIVTGIKDIHQSRVGDTIFRQGKVIDPLQGYAKPKPMVFFGMYPKDTNGLVKLKEGLAKYALNDTSISITGDYSNFLGSGFRVGFLGLLHADIVRERLTSEDGIDLLLTSPQVQYEKDGDDLKEPFMHLTVYTPSSHVGSVITICQKKKGTLLNISYFEKNAILEYEMPYAMLIRGLAEDLKSATSGFASLDYVVTDYKKADLVNIEVKINDMVIDVLSELVYKDEAPYKAREKVERLKNELPRQQFKQIIQAVNGGTIIAREEIPPFRKDVLAKMSGGDRTRKDKLLDKQKKGKNKMIGTAKINIPQEVLFSLASNKS